MKDRKPGDLRYLAAILFFIAVSIAVIFFANGYQYHPEEGLVKTSVISFEFELPGASVMLDGKAVEKIPPFSISVEPGWHLLRFEKAGCRSWEKEIYIEKDKVFLMEELVMECPAT